MILLDLFGGLNFTSVTTKDKNMFGYSARRIEQLSDRVDQLNMLHLSELGKLHQRVAALEQELAERKARESQLKEPRRRKQMSGW